MDVFILSSVFPPTRKRGGHLKERGYRKGDTDNPDNLKEREILLLIQSNLCLLWEAVCIFLALITGET